MVDQALRNVIVTGASRGIGLAVSQALIGAGYRVIAVSRSTSSAFEDLLSCHPDNIFFAPFDLEKTNDISDFARRLRKEFGPIYGLVNNAGLGTEGLLVNMSYESIDRLVRLNTLAPILMAKHVLKSMLASGQGRIVNMSSIVAGTGYSGLAVYAATKSSMIGFSRSLAREIGSGGITVNAIAPGFIETDLTSSMNEAQIASIIKRAALKRLPVAQDVAYAVVYLLSDAARNITGIVLTIDAGNTA